MNTTKQIYSKTNKIKKCLTILIFLIFFKPKILIALENKILFKVNNEIITTIDISNEINYLQTLNDDIGNLEKKVIFEIAKNNLIREKIKEIELLKSIDELNIQKEYLDILVKNIYSKLGFNNINDFKNYLKINNVPYVMVEKKNTLDALWRQYIFQKYNKKIKINKEQLKKEILSYKSVSYDLSEILFNIKQNENFIDKFREIKESINQNGFKNTALIYSISDNSNLGGKIGWVKKSAISKKILQELINLETGEYTNPIKVQSGFLILKIDNFKEDKVENINFDDELKKITNAKINEQLNQYSNLYLKRLRKNIKINE